MPARSPKPVGAEAKPRLQTTRRERQIVRILALLRILGQGTRPTVHELAAEFRTRRETIYRDLRVLQDAGYPITGDERGRLSRPRLLSSQTPGIRFSTSELNALLIAVAQTEAALPGKNALAAAALKLQALVESAPESPSRVLDEIFETWNCGSKDYRAHERLIVLLIEAILRKRRCMVTYRRPLGAEAKSYTFDPYRLLLVGGGLYVIGRVPKHGGSATLAIDRLLAVSLSETEFAVDPAFDPAKCRRDAFGVSWEDPGEIVLRFRADQAPYVREREWHPSQELVGLPNGGVQLTLRAGGPFEIRRWILGWGDAIEVISPDTLRREIEDVLRRAATLYSD